MTKSDDKPLHNENNDEEVSSRIKEFFYKYPDATPKECCRTLGISHKIYGNRIRQIKHREAKWKQSIVPTTKDGQVLNPHNNVHRVEYFFRDPIPESFIILLEEKALNTRVKGAWYRSPNRNRQLYYFDDNISIYVYPKNRTCRILPRQPISFEDLRVKVENAFAEAIPARVLLSDAFGEMIIGLQIKQRHRVFPVGLMIPFKNDFYKESLGLGACSDKSHLGHMEFHEYWPSWIPELFRFHHSLGIAIENYNRILSEFSTQIKSHIEVMKGIGIAVNRLNKVVQNLDKTLDKDS